MIDKAIRIGEMNDNTSQNYNGIKSREYQENLFIPQKLLITRTENWVHNHIDFV